MFGSLAPRSKTAGGRGNYRNYRRILEYAGRWTRRSEKTTGMLGNWRKFRGSRKKERSSFAAVILKLSEDVSIIESM